MDGYREKRKFTSHIITNASLQKYLLQMVRNLNNDPIASATSNLKLAQLPYIKLNGNSLFLDAHISFSQKCSLNKTKNIDFNFFALYLHCIAKMFSDKTNKEPCFHIIYTNNQIT